MSLAGWKGVTCQKLSAAVPTALGCYTEAYPALRAGLDYCAPPVAGLDDPPDHFVLVQTAL